MRRLVWSVAVPIVFLVATASRSWAGGWRDGCPAGALQQNPDVTYPTPEAAPSYPGTNPRSIGPAPQLDSALVPTRALLTVPFLHFSSNQSASRARMLGGIAQVSANSGNQSDVETSPFVGGLKLTVPYLDLLSGDSSSSGQPTPTAREFGNVVVAGSLQHYWLTSILADKASGGPVDIASLRNAWAIQGILAFRPGPSNVGDATILVQRTAFDSALFAPNFTLGTAFEVRTEGVGCYAPFIDVRLSVLGNQDAAEQHWMMFFPETVAVGFTPGAQAFVAMFQYGLLFSAYTGPSNQALLPPSVVHRFRFGLDFFSDPGFSAGAHLDLFAGNALYDGTAIELYTSWNFGLGGPPTIADNHKGYP